MLEFLVVMTNDNYMERKDFSVFCYCVIKKYLEENY